MKRILFAFFCTAILNVSDSMAQSFETASEAIANMGPGWNLGNTLDAHDGSRMTDIIKSETQWGQPVTKASLFAMMKDAGFGVIRVPVTWYPHMGADNKVEAEWMKRVHEVVDYVISQGLYCILNVHHDTGEDSQRFTSWLKADETIYNNVQARYESLWTQIATEFRDYDEHLLFESYNEMLDVKNSWCFASFAATNSYDASIATSAYNAVNSFAQSFVNTVRATGGNNAKRNLVVNTYGACSGSGSWNPHLQDPLKKMLLPTDDIADKGHLIFQVHAYPNISDLNAAKTEVNGMFSALKTHLVSKGAPVIIGEWGTSDSNTDYFSNTAKMLEFADFFVRKAKENGMGTIYWMGLSNGSYRSLPAFSQPDLAECIVKAWRGSSFEGSFPTMNDFDISYRVTYTGEWQELNLMQSTAALSDYKGIRVELSEKPKAGSLQVKCYGDADGKEQYVRLNSSSVSTTVNFTSSLGQSVKRITLQTLIGAQEISLKHAYLIKQSGEELELRDITPYWGCTVEMEGTPLSVSLPHAKAVNTDDYFYNLQSMRISRPTLPGIYIHRGKKIMVQ